MSRIALLVVLALSLTGCGMIDTLVDGYKHAVAVEKDLEASTGLRPKVGFHWSNGVLESVTVTFPRLVDGKPLGQLATVVRGAVTRQFKQTPRNIVLAFSLGSVASDQALRRPDWRASPRLAGL